MSASSIECVVRSTWDHARRPVVIKDGAARHCQSLLFTTSGLSQRRGWALRQTKPGVQESHSSTTGTRGAQPMMMRRPAPAPEPRRVLRTSGTRRPSFGALGAEDAPHGAPRLRVQSGCGPRGHQERILETTEGTKPILNQDHITSNKRGTLVPSH